MSKGLLFWILMILWLLFGGWFYWGDITGGHLVGPGFSLLTFVLFALLGWHSFGAPIQ